MINKILKLFSFELSIFLFVFSIALAGLLTYSDTESNKLTGELAYLPKFSPQAINFSKEVEIKINSMKENTLASFDLKKEHKIIFLRAENCFIKSPLHQDYSFSILSYKTGKIISSNKIKFFPQFTWSITRCDDAYITFSKETIADKVEVKTQEPKGNPKMKSKIMLYAEPAPNKIILPVQQPTPKLDCVSVSDKRGICSSSCKTDSYSLDKIYGKEGEFDCQKNQRCCIKDYYFAKFDKELTCKQVQTKLRANKSVLISLKDARGRLNTCGKGAKYGYPIKTIDSGYSQGCCLG